MSRVLKVSNGDYRIKVTSGGKIYLDAGLTGTVLIAGTNASTSTTTGALQVSGGVGIAGDVYMGKLLTLLPSNAAPNAPSLGMFAVADRLNWNPASYTSTNPYPVFFNGSIWVPLTAEI